MKRRANSLKFLKPYIPKSSPSNYRKNKNSFNQILDPSFKLSTKREIDIFFNKQKKEASKNDNSRVNRLKRGGKSLLIQSPKSKNSSQVEEVPISV